MEGSTWGKQAGLTGQNSHPDTCGMGAEGDMESESVEPKRSHNTMNGSSTSTGGSSTASQEMQEEYMNKQYGRGHWEQRTDMKGQDFKHMTQQRQPSYQSANYTPMGYGIDPRANFGGKGEDMRFNTQRYGNGQHYNKHHTQRGSSKESFHRGGGRRTNHDPNTRFDDY